MKKKAISLFKRLKKIVSALNIKRDFLIIVLLIFGLLQWVINRHLVQTVDQIAQANQNILQDSSHLQKYVKDFAIDLNEIRRFLLLPIREYNFDEQTTETGDQEEGKGNEDPLVSLFSYLERTGENEAQKAVYSQNYKDLEAYLNAKENLTYFESHGLFLQNGMTSNLVNDQGIPVFKLSVEENGQFQLQTYLENVKLAKPTDFDFFKSTLRDLIEKKLDSIQAAMQKLKESRQTIYTLLTTNSEIQEVLTKQSLILGQEKESAVDFSFEILSAENVPIYVLSLAKATNQLTWGEKAISLDNQVKMVATLVSDLMVYDNRSDLEKTIADLKKSIADLETDNGFQALLKNQGLNFSFQPTETEDSISYNLLNSANEVIRVIYIDKITGELKVRMSDSEVGNLLTNDLSAEKKTIELPENVVLTEETVENEEDLNILIAGKNGSNVDTMIFTQINIPKHKITLISLPRDLYHENRKINSVYADYGMNELLRRISQITGYKVNQYVLVDMYVFRDLIDLVGGVNVTLENDLIDPTYKVLQNGVASTLYYPAGTYHLNGTESLRIARSRHTTSDYDRADRQQLILGALQKKAQGLGFGDATTIIKLVQTVLDKTETNIAFEQALRYYFRYQNFNLNRGFVLSTANVLESVKIPVNYNTSLQIQSCSVVKSKQICETKNALYALIPRNNNWDYIKWYFRETLGD